MRTRLRYALVILFPVDGVLFIFSLIPTLVYALANKSLPTMGGIRLLSGPFESLGIEAMIVAGIVFVVVSAFKILAGYWIGCARTDGGLLGLILVGLSAIFWYGFEIPVGWLFGIAELVLLLLAWRTLG